MAGKKPLSPARFRKASEKQLKTQSMRLKGKKATALAGARTKHYSRGSGLLNQVSSTLKQVAASHPNKNVRKQAKLGLKRLNDAHAAFGMASLCQGDVYGNDET